MNVLKYIESERSAGRKLLAILFDPEKEASASLEERVSAADLILAGGSEIKIEPHRKTEQLVTRLKEMTNKPVVLFPGQTEQFTDKADALLYLSVLTSKNYDLTTGRLINAAREIYKSGIETIPMGYILIDGGRSSSVGKASQSLMLAQEDISGVVNTAIAGCLMGKQMIYLEAGSGAAVCVSKEIIQAVREVVKIPLIVGGGICTTEQMEEAFRAGADIVVIGNHFERHKEEAALFAEYKKRIWL